MNVASVLVAKVFAQRCPYRRRSRVGTGTRRLTVAVVLAIAAAGVKPAVVRGQTIEQFDKLHAQCWELIRAGEYRQAEGMAQRLRQLAEGPLASRPLDLADACNTLATVYYEQGRFAEAEPLYKQALQIRRKQLSDEHPNVAVSLYNLAHLYAHQGRYAEAEPLCKQALEIDRKVHGDEHADVAASLCDLGNLYQAQGRYTEAESLHQQALEIRRKLLGNDHPDVARSLNDLANLYWAKGRYADAECLYRQSLETCRKVFGAEHALVAASFNNLANLYAAQGRYTEAEPLHKKALEIWRNTLGDEHPDVALSLANLAALYQDQRRFAEAERLHKQALEIRRKVLGAEHPYVGQSLANLAALYQDQRRFAEAERLHKQALEIRHKVLGAEHSDVAASLHNLGLLYAEQGRHAEAEPVLEEAEKIANRGLCEPRLVARIHWRRASVCWETERKPQALAALEDALLVVEQQRMQASGGDLERGRFFSGWMPLFDLMVSWQYEFKNPDEAFRAMERSRARVLLDQMQTAGLDLLAGLPAEEAKKLHQQESLASGRVAAARGRISLLVARRDISAEQRQEEEERLLAELRRAQFEYTRAYAEIRNASPAYRLAISDDQKPVSVEQVRQWVQGREALLVEYLLGDEGAYVFVLPASQEPQLFKLKLTVEQAATLGVESGALTAERMRAILTNEKKTGALDHLRASNDSQREQKAAAALAVLWEVLIPESQRKAILQSKYKRLMILPDATLAQLPFETLVVRPGQEPKYLLDVGPPIVYAPSATILVNLAERNAQVSLAADEPVLAVGDCNYGEPAQVSADALLAQLAPRARYRTLGGQPERLKYSAWEVSFVAQVFQEKGIDVAWLKEDMATERNVRHNMAGRQIVELACHGRVDQQYGNLFGALALTPGPDAEDTANDGYLTLAETYELDLTGCKLAILSACDTNVGPKQRGEGVWALSRGFLAAGARRVAASNWLLNDEAAASTVSYFCSGLAIPEDKGEKPDYAQALHEAKRWVRSVEKWRSPYYWAPFVLIGPD